MTPAVFSLCLLVLQVLQWILRRCLARKYPCKSGWRQVFIAFHCVLVLMPPPAAPFGAAVLESVLVLKSTCVFKNKVWPQDGLVGCAAKCIRQFVLKNMLGVRILCLSPDCAHRVHIPSSILS